MGGKDLSDTQLQSAMESESKAFGTLYLWLRKQMGKAFFDEVGADELRMVVHRLMGFEVEGFYAKIDLPESAIVLSKHSPDADTRVLSEYQLFGIKNYIAFVSDEPPPIKGMKERLRITLIHFTKFDKEESECKNPFSKEEVKELYREVMARGHTIKESEFTGLFCKMNSRFLRSMTKERLVIALDMFCRAKTRDHCQYEVLYSDEWKTQKRAVHSMQIVLAWRNTPKYRFLYRLAKMIGRHGLRMTRVNATYIDPYSADNIVMLSLGIHGANGKGAETVADIDDFLRELVTLKYFDDQDGIERTFVETGILRGNMANYLRTAVSFCHQALVRIDPWFYSFGNVEEALCRHPELTAEICAAFELKFNPKQANLEAYETLAKKLQKKVEQLDTGHEMNDIRRKNVLTQALNFVEFTLKTNVYRNNKSSLIYRLDPRYLDFLPCDRKDHFPELPYAIFFVQGMQFIGFHIRFKDLARGGLRTIMPREMEALEIDRNTIFTECYNLSYTQQKKNKDIPEGGSKGVILLEPYGRLDFESEIYAGELQRAGCDSEEIEAIIGRYREEKKRHYLYAAQRSFIRGLLSLINTHGDGTLKAKNILDYWGKPEYIYLGPDENMHNEMIEWIARYSQEEGYTLGSAFISSKPSAGINHKEYGITSHGVNVCMEEVLNYLEIDPEIDTFTVKMTGGPDGDVAGNQILNLYKYYPKTAKLVALIDGSGTIRDMHGLDLKVLADLFAKGLPISHYPPEKLHDGGFLLDNRSKRQKSSLRQQTLLWKKEKGQVIETWVKGNEAMSLLRHNVHDTPADIFIPAGGRPRTLHEGNALDFVDKRGRPTAKAIVEGANLYLSPGARHMLEERGAVIIKDSSANKGGVICSSLEVLCNLVMGDDDFLRHKEEIVSEIKRMIAEKARDEASLLLRAHCETGDSLIDLSDQVSAKINRFTYEILDFLAPLPLVDDPNNALVRVLINYCPPLIRHDYIKPLLHNVPDIHKKAIIACFIGSKIVYTRGLKWWPSIADILPLITNDPCILDPTLEP